VPNNLGLDFMSSVRIYILGGPKSGKQSLKTDVYYNKFSNGHNRSYSEPCTDQFKTKTLEKNKQVNFYIDLYGSQDRFSNVNHNKAKAEHADVVFILIDMSNDNSADDVDKYLNEYKDYVYGVEPAKEIILVGTKSDCATASSNQIIVNKARELGFRYVMTSAKVGEGINDALFMAYKSVEPRKVEAESSANNTLKNSLYSELVTYTSSKNKASAYAKLIFSFGVFSLAWKKQKLAEQIKQLTRQEKSVGTQLIQELDNRNKNLVSTEFHKSCFFSRRYVKRSIDQTHNLSFDLGDLGEVVNKNKV
jgi:hypothetical protein